MRAEQETPHSPGIEGQCFDWRSESRCALVDKCFDKAGHMYNVLLQEEKVKSSSKGYLG